MFGLRYPVKSQMRKAPAPRERGQMVPGPSCVSEPRTHIHKFASAIVARPELKLSERH